MKTSRLLKQFKKNIKKSPLDFFIPFFLFFGVFLVYLHNLSPSIYGYDSGDFASAIITRGVAHPSGYPLYTMLGILFNMLPINQTIAWKIGLVSVFSSAFAVLLSYFIILELLKNRMAALFGALSISFFYPFWLYAEVVEVLSLNSFFVALLMFLAVKFHKTKKIFFAYLLSFSAGLSLTNNEVIILLFPAIGIVFLSNWKQILKLKIILLCILFFTLGLLPYIYIPIAASRNPVVNIGNGITLENFIKIVLRKSYGWGIASKTHYTLRPLIVYNISLVYELGIAVIPISALGAIFLFIKKKRIELLIFATGFILTGPFYFIYSRIGLPPHGAFFQIGVLERFIISSGVILIFLFSSGIYFISILINKFLLSFLKRINTKTSFTNLTALIMLVFFLHPLNAFNQHFKSTDFHDIRIGDRLGKDILSSLPKNSLILLGSDTAVFNSQYIQLSENFRTDVFIPSYISIYEKYKNENMELKKATVEIARKYLKLKKDDVVFELLMLRAISKKTPVFYLYAPDYDAALYPEIKFMPYGLLSKLADENDLKLTQEEFVKQQDKIFEKMQFEYLSKNQDVLLTNYNFIHISSIYSLAYLRTSSYILEYYKDSETAKVYFRKAKEIDPTLQEPIRKYLYPNQNKK